MKSRLARVLANVLLFSCVITSLWAAPAIIPLPQQMQTRTGVFTLCPPLSVPTVPAKATVRILADSPSLATAEYLAGMLLKSTGYEFPIQTDASAAAIRGTIILTTVNALTNLGAEGYELTVAPDSVVIRAPAQAGLFYGVQSLFQLFPPQILSRTTFTNVSWTASCVYIQDKPRFVWRGWMLDVVRHFFNKQEIEQVLDAMALNKLNMFHWHLVDDQGWRIEILKYPLLTSVGAWRNTIDYSLNNRASTAWNSSGKYGGYYTQADIREVVAYAAQRHITVVPEIEMPGHSTAGLISYPQYSCNPGYNFNMDSINYTYDVYSPGTAGTFGFLEDILTEVIGLFPSQYIHCGGDEVSSSIWKTYPADNAMMQTLGIDPTSSTAVQSYQHWFTGQIANFVQSKGRTLIGWSEIEYGGALTNAAVMDWLGTQATAAAQARQNVVMSPTANCYFDYYQNTGVNWSWEPPAIGGNVPLSTVYSLEPIPSGVTGQYTNYILGAQGNQWCEYVPSILNVEFKSYPRLCAIAEVTWTPAAMKNYSDFTTRFATHGQRLTQMGINYDKSAAPPSVGTWTSPESTTYHTQNWDASNLLTAGGEVDVSFSRATGALVIQWVALQEDGVEIDRDTHNGTASSSSSACLYVLHLPFRKPGSTYTIQANIAGSGSTTTTGTVYLPNWN